MLIFKERAAIDLQLREAGVEELGVYSLEQAIEQPLSDPQRLATGVRNEEEVETIRAARLLILIIFMNAAFRMHCDALKIPDVREGINARSRTAKRNFASNSALG